MSDYLRWCAPVAALFVLLAMGPPASASLTPLGSSVSGTATDAAWNFDEFRCPRSDFTGTVSNATTITGRLTFSADATPCLYNSIRAIMTWACRGTVTFTVTSSTAGVGASGTLSLDSNFVCEIGLLAGGCRWTMSGPQGPFSGWTYSQATQRLTVAVRTTGVAVRGSGYPCVNNTWWFTATYAVSPRVTVS